MSMLQRLSAIALASLLTVGTATATLAQDDATPGTGSPAATPAAGSGAPVVGDAVPIYDTESGEEIASITVESVTDPFEEYSEYSAPERGSRYIAVEYTVENLTENDSIDSPAYYLSLGTDQGLLISQSYVSLADDSDVEELTTDEILGGESATGTLVYQLPEDVEVGGFYYNAYGYYTLLADVSGTSSPAVGDVVTAYTIEGEEYAALSITDYQDPFEDYGEYSAPASGERVIAVTVSGENLISNDGIDFGPGQFQILTGEGIIYGTAYGVEPGEDSDLEVLEDGRIGGGESAEGTIFFVLPEETEVSGIIFSPESGIVVNIGNPNA